ncbi:MAG: UPF0182 family protein, partial [Eubacteriales bacterium]
SYAGKTGIPFTMFNRLMLSFSQATPSFFLSSEITPKSKILLNRNILERVKKLTPFLKFDKDPYCVIDNGKLKWIIDSYTTASTLPYSNVFSNQDYDYISNQNCNYIRNSVKIVIDAYDGTVDYYISDPNDPIIQTYSKIFPGIFKDISELPNSLKSHLRYPETLFSIQSEMLNTFHMQNPRVFYNKEDVWSISKELYDSTPQQVKPYYTIMKLPGEDNAEFILMIPFTPASSQSNSRNNMIAWLAARMDGDNYGQLILYSLPNNIEVDGPLQIESKIDQDPEISRQLTLWDQNGSSVIRGNLLVIPIDGNFLYVEPVYLQSDKEGSLPELRRVIVAYKEKLVMAETLDATLIQIFGENYKNKPATNVQTNEIISDEEIASDDEIASDNNEQPNIKELLDKIEEMKILLDSMEKQLQNM